MFSSEWGDSGYLGLKLLTRLWMFSTWHQTYLFNWVKGAAYPQAAMVAPFLSPSPSPKAYGLTGCLAQNRQLKYLLDEN